MTWPAGFFKFNQHWVDIWCLVYSHQFDPMKRINYVHDSDQNLHCEGFDCDLNDL